MRKRQSMMFFLQNSSSSDMNGRKKKANTLLTWVECLTLCKIDSEMRLKQDEARRNETKRNPKKKELLLNDIKSN